MRSMGKSLVADFIGTFALILLGAGAGTLAGAGIAGSLVTVALAHGLTIMIFAYALPMPSAKSAAACSILP